ncbi:MAG TPA: PIN domain-containing protein [Rhizomicrobium sp.]|jgi:predicted nucleic acid-binding protein|nr:PIN domain-containing protein [Acidisoma sp.]
MAASRLVDAGFLLALINLRDSHHNWAVAMAAQHPPPWKTCEAVLSETFHLLGPQKGKLSALLQRGVLTASFDLGQNLDPVLALIRKYADVPMSLADACLVRMSETVADPILLTTDSDFRVYRRHSRQAIPAILPA